MMDMTAARCVLGSVVYCPGIGIPRFWHLVIWVLYLPGFEYSSVLRQYIDSVD